MICQFCEYTDGCEYTSLPPQIKCTITNNFHYYNDECDIEWTPITHGRWMTLKSYPNVLLCSECNTPYEKKEFVAIPNYCPNCGAKMDKGEQQ